MQTLPLAVADTAAHTQNSIPHTAKQQQSAPDASFESHLAKAKDMQQQSAPDAVQTDDTGGQNGSALAGGEAVRDAAASLTKLVRKDGKSAEGREAAAQHTDETAVNTALLGGDVSLAAELEPDASAGAAAAENKPASCSDPLLAAVLKTAGADTASGAAAAEQAAAVSGGEVAVKVPQKARAQADDEEKPAAELLVPLTAAADKAPVLAVNAEHAESVSAAAAQPERKERSRAAEKPVISVIDERTQPAVQDAGQQPQAGIKTDFAGNGTAQMSLTLSSGHGISAAASRTAVQEPAGAFSSMLSAQIGANAAEFVKTGSIILRDNNSGSINLVLHPEELGDVKISLKLTDKIIAGHITVASQEAYTAFKNNIEVLRQAFVSSGFEAAGFELSWSGSGAEQQESGQGYGGHGRYQGLAYAEGIPDAVGVGSSAEKRYADSSQYAVNVMA